MSNTAAYTTIDAIVNEVIADRQEPGTHNYDTYLVYALRGAREWHLDSAQEVRTVKLTMNSYNAIDWPEDYVDWCKIGIQVGDKVKTFGANNESISLNFDGTDECGNPTANSPSDCNCLPSGVDASYGGYYFNNYVNEYGELLGRLFGYGGGGNSLGSWRLNRERKQFQFESNVTAKNVYLEYISNGFNPCEQTVLNIYAADMLRQYVHWQIAIFKKGKDSGEAASWEDGFYAAQRLARGRVFELSVQDIIEISRKNYKLSIKN